MSTNAFTLPQKKEDYQDAYAKQERALRLQKFWNYVIAGFAFLIPPLSLLLTLSAIYKHLTVKNEKKAVDITSLKFFIFLSLFAAFLPIFSGLISMSLATSNVEFSRINAPLCKITCTDEEYKAHKDKRKLYKDHHSIQTQLYKSSKHTKPSKFVIDAPQGKDIFMDHAQLNRWNKVEAYAKNPWKPQELIIGASPTGMILDKPPYDPMISHLYAHEIDTSQRLLLGLSENENTRPKI